MRTRLRKEGGGICCEWRPFFIFLGRVLVQPKKDALFSLATGHLRHGLIVTFLVVNSGTGCQRALGPERGHLVQRRHGKKERGRRAAKDFPKPDARLQREAREKLWGSSVSPLFRELSKVVKRKASAKLHVFLPRQGSADLRRSKPRTERLCIAKTGFQPYEAGESSARCFL